MDRSGARHFLKLSGNRDKDIRKKLRRAPER